MTERTIIAVVSDLIKTGLTVEQQILVNELALVVADAQRSADSRRVERERKRAYRGCVPGQSQDKRKEPKENNIYNNITPLEGVKGEPLSQDNPLNACFAEFWAAYPRKVGKGEAKRAYRNALKRASHEEIMAGLRRYVASKPDPEFTKHPGPWLNADRWADEPLRKPTSTVLAGPWKPVEPEKELPKISEEERQANLAKLATIKFGAKKL